MSYGTLTARREKGYEMSAISISAIICTYNGGRYLKRAIESLASQSLSRKDYEIIVVDNCSTDSTKEIVGSLLNNVENLRYCYEPEIGLSHARNRGIQEARGEVVAFIDDDAEAEPEWLEGLLSSYRDDRIACVGGKSILKWPDGFQRPKWLHRKLEPFLSGFDPGVNKELEVRGISHIPYGVNISFRRRILEKYPFRADLGRTDKGIYGGEETELCLRLLKDGWKVIYNPAAVVHHIVPDSRIEQTWFLKRALDWGISRVVVDHSGIEGTFRIRYMLSYLFRLLVYTFRYAGYSLLSQDGNAFNSYIRMRSYLVSVNYCLRHSGGLK